MTRIGIEHVKSIIETPILDSRKWLKVEGLDVDAVLLDMEDSVPETYKDEARNKIVRVLEDGSELGNSLPLPRINGLSSNRWTSDLEAVVSAGADYIVCPKVDGQKDLNAIADELARMNSNSRIIPIIESGKGVLAMEEIAAHERTAALFFGPADLAEDVQWELFEDDKPFEDVYYYVRSKLRLVAAVFGLPVFDAVFVPDIKDMARVEDVIRRARLRGFSGMVTFYPPHLEIINRYFNYSKKDVEKAEEVVRLYEIGLERGVGAVQKEGRAIILQDYKNAKKLLSKVEK